MPWKEFRDLLSGLGSDTPLGRIVAIRAEDDKEILKNYTKGMKKIRNDYRNKNAQRMDKKTYDAAMKGFDDMFRSMCG